MALDKIIERITTSDLAGLIEYEVREGKNIDYKQSLPGNSYDDKKEFLADVSSFANAAGGHLVFGMKEDAGLPVDLCGLGNIDVDDELLRLENTIRDNVKPRIPGISMCAISLDEASFAVIVHIPRSWTQPHVVDFKGHWRFYSRNSSGKYPLDVAEVRSSFALSETIMERIIQFRTQRLGKIIAGETPMTLSGPAKIVLHLIPMGSIETGQQVDFALLPNDADQLAPICCMGWNDRHNFDGYLTYDPNSGEATTRSYLQVF